jgi:glycopeptide antibiotics resistance protein
VPSAIQGIKARHRLWQTIDVIVAALPICIGASIYLLFRSNSILIFKIIGSVGAEELVDYARITVRPFNRYVSGFVLYSLPTALWAFSFMFCIARIWGDQLVSVGAITVVSLTVAIVLGSELGQGFDLVPGRFDVADITANVAGLVAGGITAYATQRFKRTSIC